MVTIPLEEYQGYLFPNFGFMTTYDDMHVGQDFVSWLIWPHGLFILQDFTSRYCLTINCIAKKLLELVANITTCYPYSTKGSKARCSKSVPDG